MKCPRCGVELDSKWFRHCFEHPDGELHTDRRCADLSAERARRAEADEDAARGALSLAMRRHDREMRELVTATGIPWEGKSHEECVALVAAELAAHRATAAKLATAREALERIRDQRYAGLTTDFAARALAALAAESGKETEK